MSPSHARTVSGCAREGGGDLMLRRVPPRSITSCPRRRMYLQYSTRVHSSTRVLESSAHVRGLAGWPGMVT